MEREKVKDIQPRSGSILLNETINERLSFNEDNYNSTEGRVIPLKDLYKDKE